MNPHLIDIADMHQRGDSLRRAATERRLAREARQRRRAAKHGVPYWRG